MSVYTTHYFVLRKLGIFTFIVYEEKILLCDIVLFTYTFCYNIEFINEKYLIYSKCIYTLPFEFWYQSPRFNIFGKIKINFVSMQLGAV